MRLDFIQSEFKRYRKAQEIFTRISV